MLTHHFDEEANQFRQHFDLDYQYSHLSLGMLAPHPRSVQEAVSIHREGFNKNPTLYYRNKDKYENLALEAAARYLCTSPKQIALTESTTMGLFLVYGGLKLGSEDEILTTVHEHYAALEILRFRELSDGVQVRKIRLYEQGREAGASSIVEKICNAISDKTRVLALTWVHSCSGVKIPLREIAQLVSEINRGRDPKSKILICVDGLHGFGIEDSTPKSLGCDFFISGCHKWLFGPRGTGLVWGKEEAWESVSPKITSFKLEAFWPWYKSLLPEDSCPRAWLCSPGGFQAYEHRWALSAAFDFHDRIGKSRIQNHIHSAAQYLKKATRAIPGVFLHTPSGSELSSGIVCFEIKNLSPDNVVEDLLNKGIITGQTPYRHSLNRFMPSIVNNREDLDRGISALRALASRADSPVFTGDRGA